MFFVKVTSSLVRPLNAAMTTLLRSEHPKSVSVWGKLKNVDRKVVLGIGPMAEWTVEYESKGKKESVTVIFPEGTLWESPSQKHQPLVKFSKEVEKIKHTNVYWTVHLLGLTEKQQAKNKKKAWKEILVFKTMLSQRKEDQEKKKLEKEVY